MKDFIIKKHKWICGTILVLQIFYLTFLRLMFVYDMKHDTSKGWGGLGASMLMERQIPILFFQCLLFIWAVFVKEKNEVQIGIIYVGSFFLILANLGLIKIFDDLTLYLF